MATSRGATIIICSRPDQFHRLQGEFPSDWGRCFLAIAPEPDIQNALIEMRHRSLALSAEKPSERRGKLPGLAVRIGRTICRSWFCRNLRSFLVVVICWFRAVGGVGRPDIVIELVT